ncbi:MAG: hypothetical protein U9N79_04830 [Actinomycetota bacterium]|nr:hypothetical protein [Actinomycetota bacterium]
MDVVTGFDPAVHGFHFRNRFSGSDVIDELVEQHRLDELAGIDLPTHLENLVGRIRDASFWGAFGLCGGMSWASLDRYLKDEPPPIQTSGPARDTALFNELVARQADSMQRGQMITTCLRYQIVPEVAPGWWPSRRSLGRITEIDEWPKVKASLDSGRPAPICLVRVRGMSNPDRHHQVLTTGYHLNRANVLTINVYDPNHPDARPEIALQLGTRRHDLNLTQTTREPLYGFFTTNYRPA